MIKGLNKLMNNLSEQGLNKMSQKPLKEYMNKVVTDAKTNAPSIVIDRVNGVANIKSTNVGATITGGVKNGVGYVDVGDPEGPYIEFGTGQFARDLLGTYPPEWQDIASDFYAGGKGTTESSEYLKPAFDNNEKIFDQELQKMLDKL